MKIWSIYGGPPFALILSLAWACRSDGTGPDHQYFQNAGSDDFDVEILASAFDQAEAVQDLRSFVVSLDMEIVAETYGHESGPGPDSILHVMSVTKSVTATLVGIAVDEGFIDSVHQTVSDFFGEEVDSINPDLGAVTLHQLMTMTSGHVWHEITDPSEFSDWIRSDDQILYIFNKPIVNPPGTVFDYSDGAAHLVSAILERATGMATTDFADQYLFGPMGLGGRGWYSDNRGVSYGGVGLRIGPRDMVELGNLYLGGGMSNGVRIVSEEWIEEATSPKVASGDHIQQYPQYGYYWWLRTDRGHDCSCAIGYGGQFILVCPDAALVVVATADYRGRTSQEAGATWSDIAAAMDRVLVSVR